MSQSRLGVGKKRRGGTPIPVDAARLAPAAIRPHLHDGVIAGG
jgi:hypothetical protein